MKKPYSFRLPIELMEAAQKKAKEENRTITNWIETLIKDKIRKEGKK